MLTALAATAGVAGFALSLWIAYLNQLRRAKMSARLLAAPTSWSVFTAWEGGLIRSASEAEGNVVWVSGEFPAIVTNDGPRGGAVWGLRQQVEGAPGSLMLMASKLLSEPYPLAGRSCEGVTFSFSIVCRYGDLEDTLRTLGREHAVTFKLTYCRLGWWGRAQQRKSTAMPVSSTQLLMALRDSPVDLAECQVLAWLRSRVAELFSAFGLDDPQLSNLQSWSLLRDDYELVIEPSAGGEGSELRVKRAGSIDGAWWVTADRTLETLEAIRTKELELVAAVRERRAQVREQMESFFAAAP